MGEYCFFDFNPNSKLIKYIKYDYLKKDNKKICEKLSVYFNDGSILEYSPPIIFSGKGKIFDMEKLYSDFTKSESVGKFWHKNIKSKLECKKIR